MPNEPLDTTFRALADPTRRKVLTRLAEGPATVSALAAPFAIALPSFLQHLRLLEAGGLIRSEKRGRVRTCRLETGRIAEAEAWIAAQRRIWEERLGRLDEHIDVMQRKEGGDEE